MNLKQKLGRLRAENGLALYKWTCGKTRVADGYILLSDLRLNVLVGDKGRVTYSVAAPVLYMDRGLPVVSFRDHDVLTVTDGARKGINVLGQYLRPGEKAVQARFCTTREITDDKQPSWLEDKIMSMGGSPVYPVGRIVMPEMFRISRQPETFRLIWSRELISAIGGRPDDTVDELRRKFVDHKESIGTKTDSGYVISYDHVASGGCCVVASRGITLRSGSIVHMMPLETMRKELKQRKWEINTGEDKDELAGNAGGGGQEAAGGDGDGHDGIVPG